MAGLVLLGGCMEVAQPPPELLLDEGDPCRPRYAICLDDESVRECIDGYWTDRSCAEHCGDVGPAMTSAGCAQESLDTPDEGCQCVPEPGFCAPGETRCDSDLELGYCDDQQIWMSYACDDLCAESLATPISTGCDLDDEGVAACWCVAE